MPVGVSDELSTVVVTVRQMLLRNTFLNLTFATEQWIKSRNWLIPNVLHHRRWEPRRHFRYSDYPTVMMTRDSNPGRNKRIIPSPNRPERLWGPLSFLFKRCRHFPGTGRGSIFTTHRHQLPRLKAGGAIIYPPTYIHGVTSNVTFPFFTIAVVILSCINFNIIFPSKSRFASCPFAMIISKNQFLYIHYFHYVSHIAPHLIPFDLIASVATYIQTTTLQSSSLTFSSLLFLFTSQIEILSRVLCFQMPKAIYNNGTDIMT
jgi:hypothetical protein